MRAPTAIWTRRAPTSEGSESGSGSCETLGTAAMARPAPIPTLARKGIMLLENGGQKYRNAVARSSAKKKATPDASCSEIIVS